VLSLRLKLDLHVHTVYSDGSGNVGEVLETAKDKGLDGLAITDHDTLGGYFEASASDCDLLIIPGFEVETDAGHVLVLGLERLPSVVGKMEYEELISWARGLGGLTVLAHPAAGRFRLNRWMGSKPDVVEVFNASYPSGYFVRRGLRLAERLGLPSVGGSDAHHPQMVGDAFTVVEADGLSSEAVVEAIRGGSVGFEGTLSPLRNRIKIGVEFLAHKLVGKFTRVVKGAS
jgi:predicted metal-dependent phosphoesterase TrpH